MKLKSIVKLFLPPILISVLNFFKKGKASKQREKYTEKIIAYNYYVDLMERKKISFTNIERLSKDYTFEQLNSITIENDEVNYYGGFFTLNRYCDSDFPNFAPVNFSIQHGVIFFLENWELGKAKIANLVWSEKISKLYKTQLKTNNVYAIGSPFFYAKSLLSADQIAKEKNRLGRNLLAFPMHSTHWIINEYNPNGFIEILKEQRKKFDSVRVCLYWKDIQMGMADPFLQAGFECVTCGHIYDQFFLQRQKTLFEIADATISNRIGSQAGYSIFMNKPHWIVPDSFEIKNGGNLKLYKDSLECASKLNEYGFVTEAFMNNQDYQITERQRQILDDFWGVSSIKSKEELADLIAKFYVKKNDGEVVGGGR